MFISIVIPVYNKGNLLNDCIKSVLSQSNQDFEILIINDGSTDNSEKVILEWLEKDNRIRYYKHENKGVSLTRNRSINLAKGKYMFFLDADDELTDNALSPLVTMAKKTDADIVMGNYIHRKGEIEYKRIKSSRYQYLKEELFSNLIMIELFLTESRLMSMATNKLYKSEFIKKHSIKFEPDVLAEDRLFNLQCYLHEPSISTIDCYTYLYKYFSDSRSQILKSTLFEESINLLQIFDKYIKNYNLKRFEDTTRLMELIVLYDVFKIISTVFDKSDNRFYDTRKTIKRLQDNEIISRNLKKIYNTNKFSDIKNNKAFNRMRLISYLLYKFPSGILVYKYLGLIKKTLSSKN